MRQFILPGLLATSLAQASTFTGTVQQVMPQPSQQTPGNTRISIYTGNTTSCASYPGWYSFDMPSASAGSAWLAILLAAITAGKTVAISGTGICDVYGVEIVSTVSALP